MKNILLFGAGKSATVLIDYLLANAIEEGWNLTVVDADLQLAQDKLNHSPFGKAASFDINNKKELDNYIANADIVLSLLPPALHIVIAKVCIANRKSLLTASYVDAEMRSLQEDIEKTDLLFLCEMGLDPGLDHMSAKKIIDDILAQGGTIHSFMSHCGGLVAPESDDNPWHYKVSWNPRNIVMAGKGGSTFKQNDEEKTLDYQQLFAEKRYVEVEDDEILCWYPNRDSLSYITIYNLPHCPTFIRTTLRHPDFIYGWKNIIDLKLTDEDAVYETGGKKLRGS
ncbi:MAG: saccharopine dehydrogenase C-terminal domain-containing protein [Chitinophagaceae bacterium]